MSSRKRTHVTFETGKKRSIDKKLIVIGHTTSTTQQVTTLFTATFPCTLTGLRWTISHVNTAGAVVTTSWALIIVRDGNVVDTIALSNAASFYNPEQDVLAFGTHTDLTTATSIGYDVQGSTKTMRKLMGGDTLQFISLASVVTSGNLVGVVQLFCKT